MNNFPDVFLQSKTPNSRSKQEQDEDMFSKLGQYEAKRKALENERHNDYLKLIGKVRDTFDLSIFMSGTLQDPYTESMFIARTMQKCQKLVMKMKVVYSQSSASMKTRGKS